MAAVGTVVAAGAVSLTLMACYGCPDCATGTYCPATGTYSDSDASDGSCPDDARALADVVVGDAHVDVDASADASKDASDDAGDGDVDADADADAG